MIKQTQSQAEALKVYAEKEQMKDAVRKYYGDDILEILDSRREAIGGRKTVVQKMHAASPSLNGQVEPLLDDYSANETEIDREKSFLESAWETTTNVVSTPFRWLGTLLSPVTSLYGNYPGIMWPLTIAGGAALAWYTGFGASWIAAIQAWIAGAPDKRVAEIVGKAIENAAPAQPLQVPPGTSVGPMSPSPLSPTAPIPLPDPSELSPL